MKWQNSYVMMIKYKVQ